MAEKPTLKHRAEALMIWALPYALRPLPFRARVRAGGFLIGGLIRLIRPLRRRITDNLDFIYPEKSPDEKRVLLKRISKNIGQRFIETFFSSEFIKRTDEMHADPGFVEKLRAIQLSGRPIFLVSGHFGQWEAVRAIMNKAGLNSGALYRVSSNPIFEKHFHKALSDAGTPVVPTGITGMRTLIKHMKSGGIMSILLDQRQEDGIWLDFMGKPALSSPSIAGLAIKYNVLVFPVYATFRPDGRIIDVEFEGEIPHTDANAMTKAINDSLTARVRKNPEQWYWLHRRWKVPAGQNAPE